MSIARVQESDFLEWTAIWQQYIQHSGPRATDWTARETFDRLVCGSPDICGLVVRETETSKVVGIAHFVLLPSLRSRKGIGYMKDLFVDPSARRKGYGRKLILAVDEEARKMGCRKVSWATDENNVAARGLYDSVGSVCRVLYSLDLE